MPIEFRCPHCNTPYRLKDELAGKSARCKNADCRQVMTIPQAKPAPAARAPSEAAPPAIDAEAAAMSALSDAPASPNDSTAAGRRIPMTCLVCEHKWEEAGSRAGKNVLCPECQHRQKVPEPKDDEIKDNWRDPRANRPTLDKRNFEKPADVQDAAHTTAVSGSSLVEAGAIEDDLEPLPLSRKFLIYGTPALLIAGLVGGGWYWLSRSNEAKDRQLMAVAAAEFAAASAEDRPPAGEEPLFDACLQMAAGEYALRSAPGGPASIKASHEHFTKALSDLRTERPTPADVKKLGADQAVRFALLGELAAALLDLGGTPEQVAAQTRYRWLPDTSPGRTLRINEKVVTVHEELRRTLAVLQAADFDQKAPIARRLTRELMRRGHADMAPEIAVQLFKPEEQPEAKATIALEMRKVDPASDRPQQIAAELKEELGKLRPPYGLNPIPCSADALFKALSPGEKTLTLIPPRPADDRSWQEPTLLAEVGRLIQEGKASAALALSGKGLTPAAQFRALVSYAESVEDASPAVDKAVAMLASSPRLPPCAAYRMVQVAAKAGKWAEAIKLVEALPNNGLREWARADAMRVQLARDGKPAADAAPMELPEDRKLLRVGHAWERMALARQAGRSSGDRSGVKQFADWPKGNMHPFGLAGFALGIQDREAAR